MNPDAAAPADEGDGPAGAARETPLGPDPQPPDEHRWDGRAGEQARPRQESQESHRRARVAQGVHSAVAALRWLAVRGGYSEAEAQVHIAGALAYVRRRVEGDIAVDEFGFDEDFVENVYLPLLRPLYRRWFRVQVRGIEHIPDTGPALVVANHAGTIALDALMTQVAVHDEHPRHRFLRALGADLLFRTPVLGQTARRGGTTLASPVDAQRLLADGELVGVWPEGFKGVGKPFSERYRLQRFGRGGFVATALRTGAPIVPCSIVGSEEIYPMLADLTPVANLLGLPYFPLTPLFPHLGPLGLVPLPSKWTIHFGEPIPTASYGAGAGEDPLVVFELTEQVRRTIQNTLHVLLERRGSVFG